MKKKLKDEITSASEAAILSANLKSVWSQESHLTQQIVIYCAQLLEKIANRSEPVQKPKRARTPWQSFLSSELRAGGTIQEAAAKWREKKTA